ncbi:hypothetical protein EV360DRAFT_67589 [Lentinula raphanica]|nr:hypothetical protein EV360DRAFT_67589 [Lentinula raphanica]
MKFTAASVALALSAFSTAVLASPLSRRDTGPECSIVVTPEDGTSPTAGAVQNELLYGFLERMSDSTYPDGTTVTRISLTGPSATDNGDGTFTAVTNLIVDGLTSDEISDIITTQWPETWVWPADSTTGYNFYMTSAFALTRVEISVDVQNERKIEY